MLIRIQNKLRFPAVVLAIASIGAASFATELHLLVHDHGEHADLAVHDHSRASAAGASEPGWFEDLQSADISLANECSLCNLPSPRLAAALSREGGFRGLVLERDREKRIAGPYTRLALAYFSRGPPASC